MRNDFKDYARTFCQLCAPFSVLYYTRMYLVKLQYSNFDILVCMFYNITLCRYR